ncbi:MAG: LacI family DNA-binding transcriptional regulator, partial [Nitrospira sp.]|nr:LacI family DNA-binding transcriptional regulator [Nitrospira sp.]
MATIYNVAKLAGVSSNTAARILRGLGGRAANVTKVIQAAEKLSYVRNVQAASLRSGRTNLIGVILPSLVSPGYTTLFQHLHDALTPHGYHVQAYCSRGRVADEAAALAMLERSRPEGVYLDAAEGESDEACDAAIERLDRQGVR